MKYLGEYLLRNAAHYPNRAAVIQEDEVWSYAELNTACNRLANALTAMGLRCGDRLAVLLPNGPKWLITLYACQKLGIGVTLLHTRLRPEEIQRTVALSGATALVYSEVYSEIVDYLVANPAGLTCFIGHARETTPLHAGHYSLNVLLAGGSGAEAQLQLQGGEPSVVLFTSGTTSAPKGVVRTQSMMRYYASLFTDEASLAKHDTMLTPAPLYHAAGLCCVIKTLVNAGTLVLLRRFDCEKICAQIERHRATQLTLVPPVSYRRLKASPYASRFDLSSVCLVHLAAGKAERACFDDLFSMFPNTSVRISWGSTETANITSAVLTKGDLENNPRLFDTVGRLNAISSLRLQAEDGSVIAGPGEGLAFVRSPVVFSGYISGGELNSTAFSEDGWFNTEDIMRRDADGYYYLLDRKRDVIKTGGENVYAQEVEMALLQSPLIRECAVVAVPDPRYGEAIAAAIVFQPGVSMTGAEFTAYCRSVLPSFKKPKYWAVLPSLPRNDIGKVLKRRLLQAGQAEFLPLENQ